jgi:hypothetical protein
LAGLKLDELLDCECERVNCFEGKLKRVGFENDRITIVSKDGDEQLALTP